MFECNNDFKNIIDRIYIKDGRLLISDFDHLLKFGNPSMHSNLGDIKTIKSPKMNSNSMPVTGNTMSGNSNVQNVPNVHIASPKVNGSSIRMENS